MDLVETAVVHALVIRSRRRNEMRRQYWVHPIYSSRLLKGTFYTLYEDLREHPTKSWSYFRMSVSAFDELLTISTGYRVMSDMFVPSVRSSI